MTDHFADRVVIVTGASAGIGRAAAVAFAESGAHVVAVGRRLPALRETAGQHRRIVPMTADIRDDDAPDRIVQRAVDEWDRLDVLVNNAGVLAMMPIDEMTAHGIDRVMTTNVTAPSLLVKAAAPRLRRTAGSIVNVSSTFGHRPIPQASHYGASKAAVEALTRSWALELAPDKVRVNAVAPGPTESGALAGAGLSTKEIEELKSDEEARIPLGRRGDPEEVAQWLLRLADPFAAWLTGQILTIDGGLELT
ncbi:SDR family oxidoreductase [Streptomyces olivaceus]|uniref:SDR family NAD(P)-dependent oxidoreductase n=1 Tax=Streptomyces olivaceus TaxID=47716 RepID=UPI001CC96000|nr:SDR family oxidoreductase [Streptomyces olivaceus]MBZ6254100.1 SDR family oxidoreductase [Streptomyces olivaceus]